MADTIGAQAAHPLPIILGEVLFDRFPDGAEVLGGAPFNVAWHLQGFGVAPLFLSRVGDDAAGQKVLQSMTAWGLDPSGVQTDPARSTGTVQVTLAKGQPTFEILPDQAYDHIDLEQAEACLQSAHPALAYHGTLIMRTGTSRALLERLLGAAHAPIFVDVNLRDPWWRAKDLPAVLQRSRWVKVNDDELTIMVHQLGLKTASLEESAMRLRTAFELELLIVTRGARGAIALDLSPSIHIVEPEPETEIVDTVGAGDAFSSVVVLGLLRNWPVGDTLHRAQVFASRICGQRGATVRDSELYRSTLRDWRVDP